MKIASAPISYGVFGELTTEGVMSIEELLESIATAGFSGSEYGPPRFFGNAEQASKRFQDAGLEAVGAYVPLHTQDTGEVLARDLDRMRQTFEELKAAGGHPLVILADEGGADISKSPRKNPDLSLKGEAWDRLVDVIQSAADEARSEGFEVSFHPHILTYVELPEEIERLLADTDLSITYDVGHIVLAGGDGAALFRKWIDRINHVHIKDVNRQVLEDARAAGREDFDEWWAEVSVRLGTGDAELEQFVDVLTDTEYDRWVVIEHDSAPLTEENKPQIVAHQQANIDWLNGQLASDSAGA